MTVKLFLWSCVQENVRLLNTGINIIGDVKTGINNTVNVTSSATNNPIDVCSVWLEPGVYLIEATAAFDLPKQTQIEIHISSADGQDTVGNILQTLPAGTQWLKNTGVIKVTGTTSKQVAVRVRQNCGSTISCRGSVWTTRIK